MERLAGLFGKIPEVFRRKNLDKDQTLPIEGLHKKASKLARRIDNRYRLSREMGLLEGSERDFFVDCCLAREVVLAEAAETSRKQEEMDRLQVRGGLPARLVRKKRELEIHPVWSVKDEIERYSFYITSEHLFGGSFKSTMLDDRLCPREQDFRKVKRQFLGSIIFASHTLYSIVAGNLTDKEKLEAVANICQIQRPRIDTERVQVIAFLKDTSLYREVFPGQRTGHFRNGIMVPVPFLMID